MWVAGLASVAHYSISGFVFISPNGLGNSTLPWRWVSPSFMPLGKFSVRGAPSTPQLLRNVAPSLHGTERFMSSTCPLPVSGSAAHFSSTRPWCAARPGRLQRSCVARNNLPCRHGVRYRKCNATGDPCTRLPRPTGSEAPRCHQPRSARCGSTMGPSPPISNLLHAHPLSLCLALG